MKDDVPTFAIMGAVVGGLAGGWGGAVIGGIFGFAIDNLKK